MLEARIQQQFFDSADWLNQSAESLSRPLAAAAQTLLGCITAGAKVMVVGQGAGTALAGYFAHLLMGRLERERPPLSALTLHEPTAGETSPTEAQIRALGQPGDVLLAIVCDAATPAMQETLRLAQDKDLTVVVLAARAEASLTGLLREADVLVGIPGARSARALELTFVSLHCLIDAIETQLLGEQDSP